jgi:formylglycine-generating enzyme required for sulfatase activity
MIKTWVSVFYFIFLMVTTVVWAKPGSASVDNGNGTVTDIETKLMWQKKTAGPMTWDAAMPYCSDLSLAGYTDRRLPTLDELETLADSTPDTPQRYQNGQITIDSR